VNLQLNKTNNVCISDTDLLREQLECLKAIHIHNNLIIDTDNVLMNIDNITDVIDAIKTYGVTEQIACSIGSSVEELTPVAIEGFLADAGAKLKEVIIKIINAIKAFIEKIKIFFGMSSKKIDEAKKEVTPDTKWKKNVKEVKIPEEAPEKIVKKVNKIHDNIHKAIVQLKEKGYIDNELEAEFKMVNESISKEEFDLNIRSIHIDPSKITPLNVIKAVVAIKLAIATDTDFNSTFMLLNAIEYDTKQKASKATKKTAEHLALVQKTFNHNVRVVTVCILMYNRCISQMDISTQKV